MTANDSYERYPMIYADNNVTYVPQLDYATL